jgi:predicted flap endonuclease-1-like 5' DNA nuclease
MFTLSILTNFCDYWWLAWLLPFILGLLLGWAIWARYRSQLEEADLELSRWKAKFKGLEAELEESRKQQSELVSNLNLSQVRVNELNATNENLKTKLSKTTSTLASVKTVSKTKKTPESSGVTTSSITPSAKKPTTSTAKKTTGTTKNKTTTTKPSVAKKASPKTATKRTTTKKTPAAKTSASKTKTTRKPTATKPTVAKKVTPKNPVAKKPVVKRVKPDNLKLIEGIGPKIEGILKRRGIKTFAQLATTKVGELREILKKAGSRFSLAEPKTWPRQARYASKGQMDKLKEYQDKLNGGREV